MTLGLGNVSLFWKFCPKCLAEEGRRGDRQAKAAQRAHHSLEIKNGIHRSE